MLDDFFGEGMIFFLSERYVQYALKIGAIWPLLEKQILEALQKFAFSLHFKRFPATSSVYQTALRMKTISQMGKRKTVHKALWPKWIQGNFISGDFKVSS